MIAYRRDTGFDSLVSRIADASASALNGGGADASRMAPLDERLVQAIWNEQLVKSDVLVTLDGRPVRVFDAGQWNGESGPDFRNADVSIGGQRYRGDIEIHVYATDWDKHGHERDFDYNGVVLHVVLYRDDDRVADELHNGSVAPRLALEDLLEPDLETIRLSMAGEDYFHAQRGPEQGPGCYLEVARVPDGLLCDLMAEAARERMETRVERCALQAASTSLDQALYQMLMTSMGHKGSKTLFFLLARRAPLDDLRIALRHVTPMDLPRTLEALLLKVSGLASYRAPAAKPGDMLEADNGETIGQDTETEPYAASIDRLWAEHERYFSDRLIPPTRRWMSGVRPVNFPMRRMAGMARFLAVSAFGQGLTAWLADAVRASAACSPKTAKDFKREIKALALLFVTEEAGYWSHHYTMGGKRTVKPIALIGDDRAMSMLFNAVLPSMLLYARHKGDDLLEKYLWRLHDNFPSLQENTITRFMRQRLFASGPDRLGLNFRLEAQNQALIHIFHECCANGNLTCENCVFSRVIARGQPTT